MSEQFNGHVVIKDGTKGPLDYSPNREVEVSISFSTDTRSDLDAITREAAKVCDEVVNEKLGRGTEAKTPKATVARTKKPPSQDAVTSVQAPVPQADPSLIGSEPTVVPASGQAISTGAERVDPNAKPGGDPAGMDDVLAPVAPTAITDTHLMSAITRRNAETTNALAIRGLIGQYVPQDGKHHGAADIEQDKRQAFLLELDKVQKANG